MYGITITDDIGRHKIIRTVQTRDQVGRLEPGENCHWFTDIDEFKHQIATLNEYKKNKIFKLIENKKTQVVVSNPVPGKKFRPENVSQDSWVLIKDYLENPEEKKVGELMSRNNIEGWTELQFCCGEQKKKLEEILKILHGLHLEL